MLSFCFYVLFTLRFSIAYFYFFGVGKEEGMSLLVMLSYFYRKPCKVGIKYMEDGTKVRVARGIGASGSIIPRPEILKIRTTPRPIVGNARTLASIVAYVCCIFCIYN